MPSTPRSAFFLFVVLASVGASPKDALSRARDLYNHQQYDAAIVAATEARRTPTLADPANLVIARAHLERFRQAGDPADLSVARDALRQIQSSGLTPRDVVELMIGLGESLYLDDHAGAAAEQFDLALARVDQTSAARRERILDWWATALDRQAQLGPDSEQGSLYARMVHRMEEELARDISSAAASYWLVVGARGIGDLERAWDAAIAGWVRAPLAGARASALRADLDRIVSEAIIPERTRRSASPDGAGQAVAAMRGEWNALKQTWP